MDKDSFRRPDSPRHLGISRSPVRVSFFSVKEKKILICSTWEERMNSLRRIGHVTGDVVVAVCVVSIVSILGLCAFLSKLGQNELAEQKNIHARQKRYIATNNKLVSLNTSINEGYRPFNDEEWELLITECEEVATDSHGHCWLADWARELRERQKSNKILLMVPKSA